MVIRDMILISIFKGLGFMFCFVYRENGFVMFQIYIFGDFWLDLEKQYEDGEEDEVFCVYMEFFILVFSI